MACLMLFSSYFHHAYQLGEHYNSVTPNKTEGDSGDEWKDGQDNKW